ncbi:MAG: hypothetical protein VW804_10555, partial [Verrucomicrobiota bacterium]
DMAKQGHTVLRGQYIETPKNKMCRSFLADHGFTEEAREAYERALLLKPTRDQQNRLLLNLAKMDQQDGNWAQALNRMKTLLSKDPSFPQQTMMLKRMKQLALQAGLKQEAATIESRLAENEK